MFDFNKIIKNYGFNVERLTDRELEEAYVKIKLSKKFRGDLKEKDLEAPIKQKVWMRFLQDLNNYGRLGLEKWFYENGDKDLIKKIEEYRKGNSDFMEGFFLYLTDDDVDKKEKYKTIREWLEEGLGNKEGDTMKVLEGIGSRKSNDENERMIF